MKKIKHLFLAVISLAVIFTSCNFTAVPNDGSLAKERLKFGYKDPADNPFDGSQTTAKFWKGYAPFVGIQCWGKGEGESWGSIPDVDMDAGTLTSSDSTGGTYMPVFGAYGEGGAGIDGEYDVSTIMSFECDVWSEGSTGKELEISVYHATANEKRINLTEEPQHVTINLTPQNTTHVLFLLGWSNTPTGDIIHMENIAFYDAEGIQVTKIPFVLAEEE